MGGIDTSDMMVYSYLDEKRNVKYWKKVVFCAIARIFEYLEYRIPRIVCLTRLPMQQETQDFGK